MYNKPLNTSNHVPQGSVELCSIWLMPNGKTRAFTNPEFPQRELFIEIDNALEQLRVMLYNE